MLLSWGAKLEARNREGWTPLFRATEQHKEDVVRLLANGFEADMLKLTQGQVIPQGKKFIQADVKTSINKCSPLRYVGKKFAPDIAKKMKERGANDSGPGDQSGFFGGKRGK